MTITMIRHTVVAAVAGLFVLTAAPAATCADIVGTVSDTQGDPVESARIIVRNNAGKTVAQAQTDSQGRYRITGLPPGEYVYVLNPFDAGFKGGAAVSYLAPKGLTVSWKASPGAPAAAVAALGTANKVLAGGRTRPPTAFGSRLSADDDEDECCEEDDAQCCKGDDGGCEDAPVHKKKRRVGATDDDNDDNCPPTSGDE